VPQQHWNRRKFGRSITLVLVGGGLLKTLHVDDAQAEARLKEIQLTVDLEDPENRALSTVGGAILVVPEGSFDPVIVVRLSAGEFAAYSSTCPHRSCSVDLPNEDGIVVCPCHNSTFDLRGRYLGGPANADLPPVALEVIRPTAVQPSTWSQVKQGQVKRR
jgi:Rieske Fe-S protein